MRFKWQSIPFRSAKFVHLVAMGYLWAIALCVVQGLRQVQQAAETWVVVENLNYQQVQEELLKYLAEDARRSGKGQKQEGGKLQFQEKQDLRKVLRNLAKNPSSVKCQLGQLRESLTQVCRNGGLGTWPETKRKYFSRCKAMTCSESTDDIFLYGNDLVQSLQVPDEQVWFHQVPKRVYPLVQSLWFLRNWLLPHAAAKSAAILWAGFWTDPNDPKGPESRTSKEKLFNFAKITDHQTVHPATLLGQLIEENGDLDNCYTHTEENELTQNMWSFASMSFVEGMRKKQQSAVVALVNKKMDGARPLSESVLFQHEVPTVGMSAWGVSFWSPQVVIIDLMGTCKQTSPALRQQLFKGLPVWAKLKKERRWTFDDFVARSRLQWACLDCPEDKCHLDEDLATFVNLIVQDEHVPDIGDDERWDRVEKSLQAAKSVANIMEALKDFSLPSALKTLKVQNSVAVKEVRQGLEEIQNSAWWKDFPQKQPLQRVLMARVGENGTTMLHLAAVEGKLNLAKFLVQMPFVDINVKDRFGWTPLHEAAAKGKISIVGTLLAANANFLAEDHLAQRPLEKARLTNQQAVVGLLKSQKGKVVSQRKARTGKGR